MNHRRQSRLAIIVIALALTMTGCGESTSTAPQSPSTATQTPVVSTPAATPTATPTPAPRPTPSASLAPTSSPNEPLICPDLVAVSTATGGVLNDLTAESPKVCGYASLRGIASGSIQSEEWFGNKSLNAYRRAMRHANGKIDGIRTRLVDRRDLAPGAFQLTLIGKVSGAIISLIVPRPGGQFASVSASSVEDGKRSADLELTEALARVFLEG